MEPRVFGVCGVAGSGKDTFSNFLVEKYGFVKMSFAESLKDVISHLFGWERSLLEGDTPLSREWRETFVDEFWSKELGMIENFTPRKAMQTIGTDLFRNHFHPNFWVSVLMRKIKTQISKGKSVIVSDCRFPNEIEMLKENFKENFTLFAIFPENQHQQQQSSIHESENLLLKEEDGWWDKSVIIYNDGKTSRPFENAVEDFFTS